MRLPSARVDGRRPRSAKARNRAWWAGAVQRALWGFGCSRRRWDGGLGEQDWVAATDIRALEDSWTSGKGVEALAGGC
jgi:hypothetical protein